MVALFNLIFVMVPYYAANIKSSTLHYKLFTWDASIHDLYDLDISSGYNYTRTDMDIGNVVEVKGEVVCFHYDLKPFHIDIWNITRHRLKHDTSRWYQYQKEADYFHVIETEADAVMALSLNRSEECQSYMNQDLSSIFMERLKLQHGDSAVFKNSYKLHAIGKQTERFFRFVVAGMIVAAFNCITFFLMSLIWSDSGYFQYTIYSILCLTMTFQWIGTIVIVAVARHITKRVYIFFTHVSPEAGILMWNWSSLNEEHYMCLLLFILETFLFLPLWPLANIALLEPALPLQAYLRV
jgi:hypothetical protein